MRALYFRRPKSNFLRMKRLFTPLFTLFIFGLLSTASAQESFEMVHQLLTTNCGGNGCHNGTTATFNVDQSSADLYADLVGVTPVNPMAAAKGNKLIAPGYPTKSFLLRKMAHGISDVLEIELAEGSSMPQGQPALDDNEIELVRQWIIYGAPETGNVVDTALINTYYRDGGIDDTYPNHEAPAAGEGFQMYMGRIFIPPLTEAEYYIKFDPEIVGGIEVPKIETYMPEGTHHFVIYSFNPGADVAYNEGLRNAYDPGAQDSHSDIKNPIATGPGVWNYELPEGTAYYWPNNTVFDLNLHIKNTSPDSIMSSDLYINVYTQPVGTTDDYMQIRLFPVLDISIPQDGQEHTFTEVANDTTATNTWEIWNLYTHTHKYGTAYNAYARNPDGSPGLIIYDGDYSYELGFDVGFYRTGPEVTFRYFPDNALFEIDPRVGMIHEASFLNTMGPDPVEWGLTSDEEMMVLGVQYIEGDALTGINEIVPIEGLRLFPNPTQQSFTLNFQLLEDADLSINVYNLIGKRVASLREGNQRAGMFSQTFSSDEFGLTAGVYFVNIEIDGASTSQKLIVTE